MKTNNLDQVSLLSGENVSLEQVLVKELNNGMENIEAIDELYILLIKSLMGKEITETAKFPHESNGFVDLTLLEMITLLIANNNRTAEAFLYLSEVVRKENLVGIKIENSFFKRKEIAFIAYNYYKNNPQTVLNLIDSFYPSKEMLDNSTHKILKFQDVLIDFISTNKNLATYEHYSKLAGLLGNNSATIDVPTVGKKVNRIDIQKVSIEMYIKEKEPKATIFSNLLFVLASYLQKDQVVSLFNGKFNFKKDKVIKLLNEKSDGSIDGLYHLLYQTLGINERVMIKGDLVDKKECLIREIDRGNHDPNLSLLYKLSCFVENGEAIQLKNGLQYNRIQLLQEEVNNSGSVDAKFSYYMETDGVYDLFESNDKPNMLDVEYTRLNLCVTNFLQDYPDIPQIYYFIGSFLSNFFFENIKQLPDLKDPYGKTPDYFYHTKRDYFRKYLEYSEPILITLNNFKGWYSLSSVMEFDSNDKEFGRTKSNILNELIQLNPSFSGIYHEYSKSLSNNTDTIQLTTNNGIKTLNRIQLLLKGIDLENGITILKFKMMVDLLQCLSDTDYKEVSFLNGRTVNKHNLILETIEDFSHLCFSDQVLSFLYKELYNTVDDDEEIEILGKNYTKLVLKNIYSAHYFHHLRLKAKFHINNFFKFKN
ncbi:hypothetical protein DICPUDRAFT_151268 [Dictyostelium purpureum]|uniref:Uncharacterized protein n=1 Tax=Dictyostelium purpureum TaxID=5786 RepID=F0ZIF0_DICPU|nr:uncharacterized protein DICPUDRAFT_151268 [Dictyostelium purpureum]EGC36247.1 hypothetical protein DICPUDRAFT_151268 [Dictyostelium purpureum]|eukprot:XP_003287193.1 hypothetical protein DICPUDRAFT_151268 [Dictyostelium purpureum]